MAKGLSMFSVWVPGNHRSVGVGLFNGVIPVVGEHTRARTGRFADSSTDGVAFEAHLHGILETQNSGVEFTPPRLIRQTARLGLRDPARKSQFRYVVRPGNLALRGPLAYRSDHTSHPSA